MGPVPILRVALALSLLGSVALGQEGLIVEPWQRSAVGAVAAPVVTPLATAAPIAIAIAPQGTPALAAPLPEQSAPEAALPAAKWTAPVVQLLVDPWAGTGAVLPARRLRWVPPRHEIVDPWASSVSLAPRSASRRAELSHSTSP